MASRQRRGTVAWPGVTCAVNTWMTGGGLAGAREGLAEQQIDPGRQHCGELPIARQDRLVAADQVGAVAGIERRQGSGDA